MPKPTAPAQRQIVNEEELLSREELLNELPRFSDFIFPSELDCLKWMARRGLINNQWPCAKCKTFTRLTVVPAKHRCSYIWACRLRTCGSRKSLRDGSFFASSRLLMPQILMVIYGWVQELPQQFVKHEAKVASSTSTSQWYTFCREVCEQWLMLNPQHIGGLNQDGSAKLVEIDMCEVPQRKYHFGRNLAQFVLRGIERGSGRCFLLEAEDCKPSTLNKLIET